MAATASPWASGGGWGRRCAASVRASPSRRAIQPHPGPGYSAVAANRRGEAALVLREAARAAADAGNGARAGIPGCKNLQCEANHGRRWLKLTSRTAMLLNNNESIGRPPERELWERLRCNNLARLLRDGEMLPARPLEGSEISLTVFSPLQLIPSHEQQSVPNAHDMLRLPLCSGESCATKSRELCSCYMKELVGEAKVSSSNSITQSSQKAWGICF
uniref:Uncharacterized protein n=1 Tax=Oryza rufipogon TaxID=4529 RepID=A0A0E0Q1Z6_ORYRU